EAKVDERTRPGSQQRQRARVWFRGRVPRFEDDLSPRRGCRIRRAATRMKPLPIRVPRSDERADQPACEETGRRTRDRALGARSDPPRARTQRARRRTDGETEAEPRDAAIDRAAPGRVAAQPQGADRANWDERVLFRVTHVGAEQDRQGVPPPYRTGGAPSVAEAHANDLADGYATDGGLAIFELERGAELLRGEWRVRDDAQRPDQNKNLNDPRLRACERHNVPPRSPRGSLRSRRQWCRP